MSTRVLVCEVCHHAAFWLRQDDRAGTLEAVCMGCGQVAVTMAILPDEPTLAIP